MKALFAIVQRFILSLLLLPSLFCTNAFTQCTGGVYAGDLTPTIAWQTVNCVRGGDFFRFQATAGEIFTFSSCFSGVSTAWDSMKITILDSATGAVVPTSAYNIPGGCGNGDFLFRWPAPATATYHILFADTGCTSNNLCSVFAYKREVSFAPGDPGIDCSTPYIISALPFELNGYSTFGSGNEYNSSHACNSNHIDSEDFVFSYTVPSGPNQCISIVLGNEFAGSGLFLLDGCPDNPSTNCIASFENPAGGVNSTILNQTLTSGQTYYIVVSSALFPVGFTSFDFSMFECPAAGFGDTCGNAFNIASLPYSQVGFSTCGKGNDYSSTDACGSSYMNGEDFVYSYLSPGNECISIRATGTFGRTGIFVTDDCPNSGGATCVGSVVNALNDPFLKEAYLPTAGTYYITISTDPFTSSCTPFNLEIDTCFSPCAANPPAGDSCITATFLSTVDSFCGRTHPTYSIDTPGNFTSAFCGSAVNNNSYFRFLATDDTMAFYIVPSQCQEGLGVQAIILETSDCIGFTAVSNCWNPVSERPGTVMSTNLTVGNEYYLMIDGFRGDFCEYSITLIEGGGSLPVIFEAFSVTPSQQKALLEWKTTSEINNKGFYIQRNTPKQMELDWITVGFVEEQGPFSLYSFIDLPPISLSPQFAYRLKQVDIDGKVQFSDIETVYFEQKTPLFQLSPSPVRDVLTIKSSVSDAYFELYSVAGKKLLSQGLGFGTTTILASDLPSGLYLYRIITTEGSQEGKVVIE